MSRRNYRPPHAALDQVSPRSARPDPRADPDEATPESGPPLRNSGRVPAARPYLAELEEQRRRNVELAEERDRLAARVGELEIDARDTAEEIEALGLALDGARAENGALLEHLAVARADKENLVDEVARIHGLLEELRKRAR